MTNKEIKIENVEEANPNDLNNSIEVKAIDEEFKTLKSLVDAMTSDFERFNSKKVKACGQRARSNLLTIKKLCDTLRKQIIIDIKNIPINHRITTDDEVVEVETKEEVKKVRKPRRANRKVLQKESEIITPP